MYAIYPLNAIIINLTNNQHVKIGRQTNARDVPAQDDGHFEPKVLSRQHAEVWEANTKTSRLLYRYSSYGVDLRQMLQQLCPEGLESKPYELKSDDIIVCTSLVTSQPCLMRFGLVIRNRHRRRRQQDDHPPQRRRTRGAASTPTRPTRLPLVQERGLGVMGGGSVRVDDRLCS